MICDAHAAVDSAIEFASGCQLLISGHETAFLQLHLFLSLLYVSVKIDNYLCIPSRFPLVKLVLLTSQAIPYFNFF